MNSVNYGTLHTTQVVEKKNKRVLLWDTERSKQTTGGELAGCVIQASGHKEERDINGLKEDGFSLRDRED